MASTFFSLHRHLVFPTKERRPFIRADCGARLHENLGGTDNGLDGVSQQVGGVAGRVHLLVGLKASHCLADFMRELRKVSSAWARTRFEPEFACQDGCAALTVSASIREWVLDHIRRQEQHHSQWDFGSELKQLLERHGVAQDPKHLP